MYGEQQGRLEHRAVAGGHRAHQGGQHELDREVPGADDQGHAERHGINEAPGGEIRQRRPDAPRLRPAPQVPERLVDLVENNGALTAIGLEGGLAQVLFERMKDRGFIVRDGLSQDPELLEAKGEALRYARREVEAVVVEELFDGSGGHGVILIRTSRNQRAILTGLQDKTG